MGYAYLFPIACNPFWSFDEAADNRDALARALYGIVFNFIDASSVKVPGKKTT